MTKEETLAYIQELISTKYSSRKEFCAACDISEAFLSDVLLGKRNFGNRLLKFVGVRKVEIYQIED